MYTSLKITLSKKDLNLNYDNIRRIQLKHLKKRETNRGRYREPTYHFHEIVGVPANLSRHYGEVQWVFSPPVHCLANIMQAINRALPE
jgi:hypothetical protein